MQAGPLDISHSPAFSYKLSLQDHVNRVRHKAGHLLPYGRFAYRK